MHDFSLTDKYVVIYDLPVTLDPVQMTPRLCRAGCNCRPAGAAVVLGASGSQPDRGDGNRDTRRMVGMPYAGTRTTLRESGHARDGDNRTCAGSRSNPATSTTVNAYSRPGRRPRTEEVLVLDVVRYSRCSTGPAWTGDTQPTWTAGSSTWRPVRSNRNVETTARRSFRGLTRRCWGAGTASATPSVSTVDTWTRCVRDDTSLYNTTSERLECGRRDRSRLLLGRCPSSRTRRPIPGTRSQVEDDGILMGYGYHRGRDEGKCCCWMPRRSSRWPLSTCAAGTDGLSRQTGRRPADTRSGGSRVAQFFLTLSRNHDDRAEASYSDSSHTKDQVAARM